LKNNRFVLLTLVLFSATLANYGFNMLYSGKDPYESLKTAWQSESFVETDYITYFPYYKKHDDDISKICFASYSIERIQSLPYPYNQLTEVLPFNGRGAYFNAEFIEKLFKYNHIVNVLEIGSDCGVSTRHIASLLPEDGKLYSLDAWIQQYGNMYTQFLSNIVRAQLTHKIIPTRKDSAEALGLIKSYGKQFDLVYVDGDHTTEGVRKDLELYFPLLSSNGVMCGDDWLFLPVRTAVLLFAQQQQLTVYAACNFWLLKDEGKYQQKIFMDASDWMFSQG